METLRQLVAGTDFSPCADHALDVAIQLARGAQARVAVVHVCELDADETRLRACAEGLARLVARHRGCQVEISGVLRRGTPWKKLDNVAVELGATVIVIGRHGAGRRSSDTLGSVALQLPRAASRSVLIVACAFDCLASGANETEQL